MKKIAGYVFLCFLSTHLFAQTPPDTSRLRISLITCSPGADLYSIFGHTAIRVIDSARNIDAVFNYGTFDDSDPYFYLKFTRGIMRYSLSVWPYNDFMEEYRAEHRNVSEQVLNLEAAAKQQLLNALNINAQEANRYYDYQFHVDNCTTRSRDIIAANAGDPVNFGNILPSPPPSYRRLIHDCLDSGGQYWNKLAIDLLLGAHLDATVTNKGAMFLPAWLEKGFDNAYVDSSHLVSEKHPLFTAPPLPPDNSWFTPTALFTALLIIGIALSFSRGRAVTRTLRIFDISLFLVTGLMGMLMCTLWIARVDTVCRNNWNVLWALPTHAIIAFMLSKQKQWTRIYWMLTSVLLLIVLVCWVWLPQEMNNSLFPLVALLLLRSIKHIPPSHTPSP